MKENAQDNPLVGIPHVDRHSFECPMDAREGVVAVPDDARLDG